MPISSEVRKMILKKLLTSPERKALYNKAKDSIKEIVTHPDVKRAYLVGSFASKKEVPKDIDLLVRHRGGLTGETAEDFFNKFQPYLADPLVGGGGKKGVGVMDAFATLGKDFYGNSLTGEESGTLSAFKRERDEGVRRYGKDYKWIRILSLLGALGSARQVEFQKEEE